jgi:hypothetical protein
VEEVEETVAAVDAATMREVDVVAEETSTIPVPEGHRRMGYAATTAKENLSTRQEQWKNKECFNCKKIGHPASHCPKDDDDEDAKSSSSQA